MHCNLRLPLIDVQGDALVDGLSEAGTLGTFAILDPLGQANENVHNLQKN